MPIVTDGLAILPSIVRTVQIRSAENILDLVETDQTDPAGRWRWRANGNKVYFEKATAADWASYDSALLMGSLGATCFVVASDAKAEVKNFAQLLQHLGYPTWVCDGDNDQEEIQAAIDAIDSIGRGMLQLHGSFTLSSRIRLGDNLVLRGPAVIKGAGDASTRVLVTNKDWTGGNSNIQVLDLEIDGNFSDGTKTGDALLQFVRVSNFVWEDIIVHHGYAHNAEVKKCTDGKINRLITYSSQADDGLSITDGDGDSITRRIWVSSSYGYANADSQFEVDDGPQYVYFHGVVASTGGGDNRGILIHTHENEYAPKHISFVDCWGYDLGIFYRISTSPGALSSPSDIYIIGGGAKATTEAFSFLYATEETDNFFIRGVTLPGGGGLPTSAIIFTGGHGENIVIDVDAYNYPHYVISMDGKDSANRYERIQIRIHSDGAKHGGVWLKNVRDVTITGMIRNSNATLQANRAAIYFDDNVDNVIVSGMNLRNNYNGIYISNTTTSVKVTNCDLRDNDGYPVYDAGGSGIELTCNLGYVAEYEIRDALANILEILGDVRGIWPFYEVSGTTISDYSRRNHDMTPSEDVSNWDTPPYFKNKATVYTFNGSDEYLSTPDHDDFSFGDGSSDNPFSLVAVVKIANATAGNSLISKYNAYTANREYHLFIETNGYLSLQLWDESDDTYIGRYEASVFPQDQWVVIVATYDGSSSAAGIKIYRDGVRVDDTDYVSGTYVAMENLAAEVAIGYYTFGTGVKRWLLNGEATWFAITGKELSADEVWSLTQRLKAVIGE